MTKRYSDPTSRSLHLQASRHVGSDPAEWLKCCHLCGRWGSRQFVPMPDGRDGFMCENDQACGARLRKKTTPLPDLFTGKPSA